MNVWEFLLNLGLFSAIVSAIAYVAKSLISQYFSKGIEAYKVQLQNNSQREIESLKSVLARTAYEHQIRFSRLYEKLAEVTEETYSNLVDLCRTASKFVALFHSNEDLRLKYRNMLWQAADKFLLDFERHRIYLDPDVTKKITGLKEAISSATAALANLADTEFPEKYPETIFREWEKASGIMEKDVPPIEAALTRTFQELLGVVKVRESVPPK